METLPYQNFAAGTESLFKLLANHYSLMIRHTFSVSSRSVFTPIGYNFKYINMFIKNYSEDDVICAEFVRDLRLEYGQQLVLKLSL